MPSSKRDKLPIILTRRPKNDAERRSVFEAVAARYGLADKLKEMLSAPTDSPLKATHGQKFFAELAISLMIELFPAYRLTRPGRRKSDKEAPGDWVTAGGSMLFPPTDFSAFYQAQFVQTVERLAKEQRKSRESIFRWLANEAQVASPKEAHARLALLPRPYQKRQTSRSLRQAFNSIPKRIRSNPNLYLPTRGLGSFRFLGHGPGPGLLSS